MAHDLHRSTGPARINWRRLVKYTLLLLVLPVTGAVILDLVTALAPVLTLLASLICIPLAAVVVNRAILAELQQVIDVVAPEPPDEEGDTALPGVAGTGTPDARP